MPLENFLLLRLWKFNLQPSTEASSLLCYDSHWPGAPCLLVPSGRRDEHYGNKPRSMRDSQLVPSLRAQPRVPVQSRPLHRPATPARPTRLGRDSLSVQVTSNTDSSRALGTSRAYQVTRSKVLSEGKPREREREEEGQSELTGAASTDPTGQVQGGALPPGK